MVSTDNWPLLKLIWSLVKPVPALEEVNVNSIGALFVFEPMVTPTVVDAMVMVGGLLSKVKVNGVESLEATL